MSHTPHELSEEFPDMVALMAELRAADSHFARQMDDYHEVNRAVHRAETDVEPTDDAHLAGLRRQRMALKDQIYRRLAMPV